MTNSEISNNKKRIKLIYVILFVVFVLSLVGTTFSAWDWFSGEGQKTIVEFGIDCETNPELCEEYNYSCAADGGGNITSTDKLLAPTTCMDSTYAIQREIVVMPTIDGDDIKVNMDAWLKINEIGEGFTNSQNLRYALTTSSSSCTSGVVSSGNFYGKETGDIVPLLSNKGYIATTTETYYLYIWLDAVETSPSTMRQPLNLSLGGSCSGASKIESPVLDDGMIPVKLSSNGTVTTVSSSDSSWYNYNNKEWANVVLVEDDSRSTYKDTTDVMVDQNDILAYYVWIPRYKYKIWTTEESASGSEQTIDIVFENATEPMSLGTQVGEYRTHPAFWWDENNNGVVDYSETIAGIWVGKFETSANEDSTCYTNSSVSNCVVSNVSPRILPGVNALGHQVASTQFTTSKKFSASGNIYGLSNATTDAHMMKNSEWGAVAYLSHSVYGINGQVRINNNRNIVTGCGALTEDSSSVGNCEITYNSLSTPQSTTGNITGVFDMSGGAYEQTMTVLKDSDGNLRSGTDASSNSGFNGLLTTGGSYTAGIDFPESKYYDLYTSVNSLTACNGGICYGHALSETANWYRDFYIELKEGYPWYLRGDYYYGAEEAGAFAAPIDNGHAERVYSWRSVLVMGDFDYESPTCSLSVDGTTINASYSDDSGVMEYYGWDSSYSGANSTSRIIDAVGTYTYYVMDADSNIGSCSITVTSTDIASSSPQYCTASCSVRNQSQSTCQSYSGCSWSPNTRSCAGLEQYTCTNNSSCSWNYLGKYCYGSYTLGGTCSGTYKYQCGTAYTYSCQSGYTKINDSYCYILG